MGNSGKGRNMPHSLQFFKLALIKILQTAGDAGNKMDSNNLATIFAPNILHQIKPGTESLSATEMAAHAEERTEVINVVRCMIDHNNELFEVRSSQEWL